MTHNEEPPLTFSRLEKIKNISTKSFKFLSGKSRNTKKLLFKLIVDYKIGKILIFNLGLLLAIVLMPWVSEFTTNKQVYSDLLKFTEPLDPLKAGELALAIAPYTAGINEDSEDVALALMLKGDNYTLSQQLSVNAGKSIDGPQRADATYEVKQGETIMQIAQKFDLHVASILDANHIKPEDSKKITPGTVLNIPSSDTSTSSDWIVAINKAEEAERQKQLELQRQQQLAKAKKASSNRAYAATSEYTSSGYSGNYGGGLSVPISYSYISRGFSRGHTGVDYVAPTGTPVHAAGDGKVIKTSTGWSGGYGNQILIDHGGGRVTRYAHLSSINVDVGQYVSGGQVIGYSGSTGRSTGPHLHYELIVNGTPVQP